MVKHDILQSENDIKTELLEDMPGIFSIKFQFGKPNECRSTAEFEVKYQRGETVCFIINAAEYELAGQLYPGYELSEIQCFSSISIFFANGLITDRKKIDAGPRKGDVAFCLKLLPIELKDGI